jgi:hypothetical protein
VLRPGGRFLGSDWLFAEGADSSPFVAAWRKVVPLHFELMSPERARRHLQGAGFCDIDIDIRRDQLQVANRLELEALDGPLREPLTRLLGAKMAQARVASAAGRQTVLDSGDMQPSHIRAHKPA